MGRHSSTTGWSRKRRKRHYYEKGVYRWRRSGYPATEERKFLIEHFGKTIRKIRQEQPQKRKEMAILLWLQCVLDHDLEDTTNLRSQITKLLNIYGFNNFPIDKLMPHGVKCLGTWEVLENEL